MVAFLPPEGRLVTRWIEGCHWKADEFRTPEHIRLLTETVKHLHTLPPTGAAFSPFRRVESYLETARGFGVPLPADFNAFLETMEVVEADQQRDGSDWRHFCHNDLVSVNYLFCEQQNAIKVLDWEFAGLGDIYYDLATLVYTHDDVGPIPPDLEDVMLACYFGEVTGGQRRRLQGMEYYVDAFHRPLGAGPARDADGWPDPGGRGVRLPGIRRVSLCPRYPGSPGGFRSIPPMTVQPDHD